MALPITSDPIVVDGKQVFWTTSDRTEAMWWNTGIKHASRPTWPMTVPAREALESRGVQRLYVAYQVTDSNTIPLYQIDVGGLLDAPTQWIMGQRQISVDTFDDYVSYCGPASELLPAHVSFDGRDRGAYHKARTE